MLVKKLSTSISIFALAAAGALPVLTQSATAQQIEEIQVTGSYIRQNDTYTAPVPTTTIDRGEIEKTGAVDLTDLVRNLPINAGSQTQCGLANPERGHQPAAFGGYGAVQHQGPWPWRYAYPGEWQA
jgi:type II secretory pathway pseudopilin PulG